MTNSYAPKVKKLRSNGVAPVANPEIKISVTAEHWRFIAYLSFWGMVAYAIVLSKTLVTPYLAAGPSDGSTCGPFNRDSPAFGVSPGKGFDFSTQSHLQELFGFANICANWDYSPSRELTAMVYPLFEYSLIVYLCLDFMATAIAHKRGDLEEWFWNFSKVTFPVCVFLCSQFRMIFVCIAYENVQHHTAGFLGLQIVLILVAVQNTLFIWDSNTVYTQLGGITNTRRAALAYLIGNLMVSSIKVKATIFVVMNGFGAPWTLEPSILPGKCVGQLVDLIWMIFNALLPLLIARFRSKNERPLEITISQKGVYEDDTEGENASLINNGETMKAYQQVA